MPGLRRTATSPSHRGTAATPPDGHAAAASAWVTGNPGSPRSSSREWRQQGRRHTYARRRDPAGPVSESLAARRAPRTMTRTHTTSRNPRRLARRSPPRPKGAGRGPSPVLPLPCPVQGTRAAHTRKGPLPSLVPGPAAASRLAGGRRVRSSRTAAGESARPRGRGGGSSARRAPPVLWEAERAPPRPACLY